MCRNSFLTVSCTEDSEYSPNTTSIQCHTEKFRYMTTSRNLASLPGLILNAIKVRSHSKISILLIQICKFL